MEEVGFSPVQDEQQPKQRPTFLTVLCVLSWISAGWTAMSSIISLATMGSSVEKLQKSMSDVDDAAQEEMPSFFETILSGSQDLIQDTINNFTLINSSQVVLYLAQVYAVYLMFNLQKKGFYLYAFVQATLLILPMTYMTMNSVMMIGLAFSSFLTLAFIIMYAVNLKHMK
jgi:hypothetical protein